MNLVTVAIPPALPLSLSIGLQVRREGGRKGGGGREGSKTVHFIPSFLSIVHPTNPSLPPSLPPKVSFARLKSKGIFCSHTRSVAAAGKGGREGGREGGANME
jgi:hypothetical protein